MIRRTNRARALKKVKVNVYSRAGHTALFSHKHRTCNAPLHTDTRARKHAHVVIPDDYIPTITTQARERCRVLAAKNNEKNS